MADDLAPAGASGAVPNLGLSSVSGPSSTSTSGLAALLVPGAVISGRVLQGLGSDHYLLNMRGTTLVVTSQVPLTSDSVVRFQVINGGAQTTLRMIDSADQNADQAQTSTISTRLQSLGLQSTPANTVALEAFEKAGAPLARDPIQATATAIAALPQSADVDSEQQAALAAAMAALAREGLPSTPATIALAMRALSTALPNPANVLASVTQALAAVAPAQVGPAASAPAGQVDPAGTYTPSPTPSTSSPDVQSAPQAGAPAVAPSPSPSPSPPSASSTAAMLPDLSAPASGSAAALNPSSGPLVQSGSSADAPQSTTIVGPGPGSSNPTTATAPTITVPMPAAATSPAPSTSAGGQAPVTGPLQPAITATTVVPAGSGAITDGAAVTVTIVDGTGQTSSASMLTASSASDVSVPTPPLVPSPSPLLPGDLALRSLLAQGIPDATQGGAPAVMQALAWSGLRSSAATSVPGSLLKHLAAALPAMDAPGAATATAQATAAKADLTQALAHAMRETSAVTVIKPTALADYDVVMGVALTDQGKNTPTRLAIAARPAPGGTTTFLRVDTELSHMGPISVRISGLNEGPMAITLLADGGGARALAEALPGLGDSLQQLGLLAGLRVASLAAEDGHGS